MSEIATIGDAYGVGGGSSLNKECITKNGVLNLSVGEGTYWIFNNSSYSTNELVRKSDIRYEEPEPPSGEDRFILQIRVPGFKDHNSTLTVQVQVGNKTRTYTYRRSDGYTGDTLIIDPEIPLPAETKWITVIWTDGGNINDSVTLNNIDEDLIGNLILDADPIHGTISLGAL